MKSRLLLLLAVGLFAATVNAACAQPGTQRVGVCDPTPYSTPNCLKPQADGSLNVNASASITGFPTTQTTGTPISVTTGGVTGTLPAGAVVVAANVGTTNNAYCKLGASATVNDQLIAPNSWFAFTVGASTQLTCITSTSTTTVNMVGGSGLPTGAGGGGGGGSSGAVTNAGTFAVQLTGATNNINNVSGTVSLPTGASTSANQSTEITALGTVNTNLTNVTGTKAAGTAAANSILNGCVFNTVLPTLTNGQQAAAQCDSSGRPLVTVSGAGDASAANQTVVQGVIGAATAPTKMAVAGGVYNSTPLTVANGQSAALQLDANGYQKVNIAAGNGVAQGAAISGQTPSTIACQALTSGPSVYTTATTNPVNCNEYGALVTQPYALQDRLVKGTTSAMTGTTSTSLLAAPGAGLKNYITTLSCVNSHATVGTFVTVQDGSGGTAIWTVAAAALFGGTAITFPAPLQQPTANTALFVADVTTGANVICSASGYKAP